MDGTDEGLDSPNLGFAEGLYADWLADPASVSADWRGFFEALANGNGRNGHAQVPDLERAADFRNAPTLKPPGLFGAGRGGARFGNRIRQDRVDQLVRSFRIRGHLVAAIDPLGRPRAPQPELEPGHYGLGPADADLEFSAATIGGGGSRTLREILSCLRNTYCRSIGVQFMHIDDAGVKNWLQKRMESSENRIDLDREEQLRILQRLTDAVVFEEFIQKKYQGAKSFSLEGAETLIPLLDLAIRKASRDHRVGEVIIGMAHRGRLNVLANVMGKTPKYIFREFDDPDPQAFVGRGDVKYHLGYNNEQVVDGKTVHLSLCFNPSHLEFVNPVAMGRMRAKLDRFVDHPRGKGLTILIHGDAAFAGEGVVQETLNLSELPGYTVGGTIHIIVNNQIGFTTPPEQGRSGPYATEVAKMLKIPIFHVNGEDPEAVAQVVHLALDFREEFKRDVVIDMYCYRKRGHNEGDEPAFTQPLLYERIRDMAPVRRAYTDHLLKLGEITEEDAQTMVERTREALEEELSSARSESFSPRPRRPGGIWAGFLGGPDDQVAEPGTAVQAERLTSLMRSLTSWPDDFRPHAKIQRILKTRREMGEGESAFDWATAESLAFATIVTDGVRIRMSGQDCERGTFSQRHAVIHDHETGRPYMPLARIAPSQAPIEILNSPLSEAGVLGYEYGYSLDYPDALVLWEAQFGDFCNAAQVIIDQFIVSAEDKWRRLSGLVLLLPHGFEGMGPEHSSARLERFLMLAAEDNIQVMNLTTPAQYFHALRRQVIRPWRKPLVIMTPKSLLRHEQAVSSLAELAEGRFRKVLPDERGADAPAPRRILLCSGKIYYDLLARRAETGAEDVAILRLEQLYPIPEADLEKALAAHPEGTEVVWVQEEPENMGAWRFLAHAWGDSLFDRHPFSGITRPASASPATGSHAAHKYEQDRILSQAFGSEQ